MTARAWAGFATMSVLWGIPYLFIKVAVDEGLSPAFVSWSRVVMAAAVLLAIAHRAGALGSLTGRGRWLALYALLEIAIPFPLIAAGEEHVDSSLAAIIIASVPLLIAVLALRFDHAEADHGQVMCASTLTTVPPGSSTKNRRTPHGSSRGAKTIS